MKMKILIASAAVGMALSTAAMATSFTPRDVCNMYQRDLNWNIMLMSKSDKAPAASEAMAQGASMCAQGRFDEGINTLTTAIKDLGLPVNQY